MEINVVHPVSNDKPVVVITYQGMRQDLQSIMLNSHMDVVPVFEVIDFLETYPVGLRLVYHTNNWSFTLIFKLQFLYTDLTHHFGIISIEKIGVSHRNGVLNRSIRNRSLHRKFSVTHQSQYQLGLQIFFKFLIPNFERNFGPTNHLPQK